MSNIEYQTQSKIQIECRKSNQIQHSNRMSNIEYQTQSHIQILNVEYRISNLIQHSNRMSNIEYQTQSKIQIECRISKIKLNPTF